MDLSKGMNKRFRKTSLLERVRQGLVTTNPTTDEEKCQFNRLIVEHQSEFPSNIRPAIIGAAVYAETRFEHFESVLFEAVVTAFAGLPFRGQLRLTSDYVDEPEVERIRLQWREDRLRYDTEEWNGLNSDVDTEEEVELMIRCFSFISRCFSPFLTCSTKSVFFVPLCIEVGLELGWLSNNAWSNVLRDLVINRQELSAELEEKSLAVLIRLKEKGLVKKGCECKLIRWLFYTYSLPNERSISFIETRLRLLIAWNPTALTLRSYPHTQYPSLYLFLREFVEIKNEALNFRIFEVLIELGMSHHPTKLGYVFFENNFCDSFGIACKIFGAQRVTQLIEDKLLSFLNQNNKNKKLALRALVLAAAIDDDISIDGVYTLLRYDPIASLTKSST